MKTLSENKTVKGRYLETLDNSEYTPKEAYEIGLRNGVRLAADLVSTYDEVFVYKYKIGDIILHKFKLIEKRQIRKNAYGRVR